MKLTKNIFATLLLLTSIIGFAQEEEGQQASNVQTYTPSKLLKKGQWDVKFFNSIYTQTEQTDSGSKSQKIER